MKRGVEIQLFARPPPTPSVDVEWRHFQKKAPAAVPRGKKRGRHLTTDLGGLCLLHTRQKALCSSWMSFSFCGGHFDKSFAAPMGGQSETPDASSVQYSERGILSFSSIIWLWLTFIYLELASGWFITPPLRQSHLSRPFDPSDLLPLFSAANCHHLGSSTFHRVHLFRRKKKYSTIYANELNIFQWNSAENSTKKFTKNSIIQRIVPQHPTCSPPNLPQFMQMSWIFFQWNSTVPGASRSKYFAYFTFHFLCSAGEKFIFHTKTHSSERLPPPRPPEKFHKSRRCSKKVGQKILEHSCPGVR